jgi:fructose-1-phosphate kinase PfkB-like protein
MVAGILAGLLEGLDLAQTARLATAFSLDAITRAESAQTSHEQIEALMPEILID